MKNDIYVKLLEFGRERGINGILRDEFYVLLLKEGCIPKDDYEKFGVSGQNVSSETIYKLNRFQKFIEEVFDRSTNSKQEEVYVLSVDGYLKWLEFRGIQLAHNNSKIAIYVSVVSILISIISVVYSSVANKTIALDYSQFSVVSSGYSEIHKDLDGLSDQIDKINENLSVSSIGMKNRSVSECKNIKDGLGK